MRPRHKAAENLWIGEVEGEASLDTSMRPRHKAAENLLAVVASVPEKAALQ